MGNQMQKSTSDIRNYELQTIFTFEINNFSERKKPMASPTFLSCGWEWYVLVDPKENEDDLRLYLCVHNSKSLITGWRTRASYRFLLLNQSGKVLYRAAAWGNRTLPLSKLKEEGHLENNKLIIKVEVKAGEERYVTGKEMFEIEGFEVPSSQVFSVSQLFMKHPDIANDFKLNGKGLKTAYMNIVLSLIETLCRPPLSFSESELSNIDSELSELIEAGFKLDWLKTKLEEVSLERKKAIADNLGVQELEERVKNMELSLSDLRVELESEKAQSAAAASKMLSFSDII
ncbi:hypothetical protein ARALYDRAFT_893459 [Arabidopsis lyrata subsp. lyrata]|uniref:MATH domain-containing protein n=2 Tax=Arabidopsis lyrata subsp. lyrata TaxID=81972 RepID=D7KWP8_ARALL|nr:hypothetical protein ARALYDRAFT_893459 [Arabidopsis lyrata subsp. lyrata]